MTLSTQKKQQWAAEIQKELDENILSFWLKHTRDEQFGGFVGEIMQDMTFTAEADKSLVLNTRILWTFSSAYRLFGKKEYLAAANRAYQYIKEHFIDRSHGGLYWMLDREGNPVSSKKQIYGQAFAIYAWSEYNRATGNTEALEEAVSLYQLIEKYGRDSVHLGYIEALAEDWSETSELSLSNKDLNEKKSMNTHLHVLEGYTNLYRVWPDEALRHSLSELIVVTMDHIVDQSTGHFKLFFNEKWDSKSGHISYGHDIEGSWLLHEAAEVLGDEALLEKVKAVAVQMAEATLREGIDEDGGVPNEADSSGLIDSNRDWWPQAEAVVGFYNAYQLTGDERYAEAAKASWTFIQNFLIDRVNGEWYWSVTKDGTPTDGHQKVGAWKCPYHNGRACFEMIERLAH
ncbi:AGE family epimerase/isomerase [Paenibacillus lupini]|uniref:AGE family epimerase/isomerase n=1 Tax=Paenibacillus lupini TaxID=1450204 RepID=UPI001421106D|nr:AGE family epimerase/isomerase [Paenibacillus lupini]NIK22179.1 mannobiose 2-epimerase [Paenibacillus lupini]